MLAIIIIARRGRSSFFIIYNLVDKLLVFIILKAISKKKIKKAIILDERQKIDDVGFLCDFNLTWLIS
jgi:energy-converting hydrogenase Eha subunit E